MAIYTLHSTNTLTSFLIGISVLGLSGLSILCPLLAWPMYLFQSGRRKDKRHLAGGSAQFPNSRNSIDILLPAHNEAAHLGATLASIQRAVDHLRTASSI